MNTLKDILFEWALLPAVIGALVFIALPIRFCELIYQLVSEN